MFRLLKLIKYYLFRKKGLFYPSLGINFYAYHQDKLRGSYEEIKKRQAVYLKYIEKIPKLLKDENYFLDIGFGRGEFIDLLKDLKLKNIEGVDINKECVLKAKQKSYTVYQEDALKHLYLSDKRYYAISAFHLIEHLDFQELFDLLVICSKKIVKSGVLILETPNIGNCTVSSTSFFLDYTHKLKLPSLLIKTLLEYLDFKVEFLYLQSDETGAQDLGVIARKL